MDPLLNPRPPGGPPADETAAGSGAQRTSCPWCSAVLADPPPDRCPGCGAQIAESDPAAVIPGVTELDPEAARAAGEAARRIERAGRSLFGWSGQVASLPADRAPLPSPGALAPPSEEVRREMARLRPELDAMDRLGGPGEPEPGGPEPGDPA